MNTHTYIHTHAETHTHRDTHTQRHTKKMTIFWVFLENAGWRRSRLVSAPSAPRPQTVGKSLFQFRNRAREKKTAAKPPAERSEANKVPSEARLINYISTYTPM